MRDRVWAFSMSTMVTVEGRAGGLARSVSSVSSTVVVDDEDDESLVFHAGAA
ncbi:hypothetical protein O983_26180 [Mycobacterium avium 09-5983]|nr:hypothetical protein O984_24310 [Mycobacterium avium 05-4293]ETB17841.1 hypothetical protein O983_26180 [Mycobacterium avium 09-5983]ETB31061.1 hypothetical protein N602_31695 [Mycobacterium avium subsp. hominissuis 10-5606]ETZ41189.1 hypothetical protein L837_5144 [Mycobacterium avium MAV_061107_1842]